MTKTDAAVQTLSDINPDVVLEVSILIQISFPYTIHVQIMFYYYYYFFLLSLDYEYLSLVSCLCKLGNQNFVDNFSLRFYV